MEDKNKADPIRDRYFKQLEYAERALDGLFYGTAAFSLLSLLIEETGHPQIFATIQTLFILSVIAYSVLGIIIHLILSPKAQVKRLEDFLAHAHGVNSGPHATAGYYNSSAADIPSKIAAQVLENSFYSADTAGQMARKERWRMMIYVVLFLLIILNRNTNLMWITFAAQIIFSEQILSRWFRIEWLKREFQQIYDELYRSFQSRAQFEMLSISFLGRYEIAKAIASTTLSERIFVTRKNQNDKEWKEIRAALGI